MFGVAPSGMVWVPDGESWIGSDSHYPEEGPAHRVVLDGFWIDRDPVTNADFRTFVESTDYVTVAERSPVGAAVFVQPEGPVPLDDASQWWTLVGGADWRHPRGPMSSISGLDDHPVVQIAYDDAVAYAAWAGRQLPTEAQWERAARSGGGHHTYTWGDAPIDPDEPQANIWRGSFPWSPTGPAGTTAVGTYPANALGCHDMAGNVWEWTTDFWRSSHDPVGLLTGTSCCGAPRHNPTGPPTPTTDPYASSIALRVLKGGSFLCSDDYCFRYRPAARISQAEDSPTCHVGFRCVLPLGTRST